MLGCSKNSIWRLRSGKSQSVDLELLEALSKWARREGYSLEWLFLGEGPPKATAAVRQELAALGRVIWVLGEIRDALKSAKRSQNTTRKTPCGRAL